ncbi:MAG: helix-turn-helix domain-containing protein [Solirubrobacteraceae bacterium]|nr:helix-turn-helix domain-containing protein [Solirubrobacteraceae bacterium]
MSDFRRWTVADRDTIDGMTPTADAEFEHRYAAVRGRDRRFDGRFFTAVTSTGIYCRPSCPARTPLRRNVRFYVTAAAAQQAGFRACRRCRPEAVPGAPEWDVGGDVAARAMRLIADGEVDRGGVPGLASRLGYSERQLRRILVERLGAGPTALARAQRARTAALLLESTTMPLADVACAAGFGSARQLDATVRDTFGTSPGGLRRAAGAGAATPGTVTVRLAHRTPLASGPLLRHLADRAVDGLERTTADGAYRRSLALPHGPGVCDLRPGATAVTCTLRLTDLRDLAAAVARCRRLLDLDADPVAVDGHLAADPVLRPLVGATPGLRTPGTVCGFEASLRATIGQQVSVAAARTVLAQLVGRYGTPAPDAADPDDAGHVDGEAGRRPLRLLPSPAVVAELPDDALPMPRSRAAAVRALATAVASGDLDLNGGAPPDEVRARLLALPGIGPWTASYVAMRALGDPDVLPAGDLGVRRAAAALGLPGDARRLTAHGAAWAPWRSYAAQHLWTADAAASPASRTSPSVVPTPEAPR